MFLRDVCSKEDLEKYYNENYLITYEDKVRHLMIKMGIREIIDGTTQQNLNELKMLEENAITKAQPFDEFKVWNPPIEPIAPHLPKVKPITLKVVGDSNNNGDDILPDNEHKTVTAANMITADYDPRNENTSNIIDVQPLPPDDVGKVN